MKGEGETGGCSFTNFIHNNNNYNQPTDIFVVMGRWVSINSQMEYI